MTNWEIILLIIAINLVVSIIYLMFAVTKKSKEMMLKAVAMILIPPIGVLYFGCQYLVFKILSHGSRSEDDFYYLQGSRKKRHEGLEKVEIDDETQYFSLEEAFAVSSDTNKQNNLSQELKKDYVENPDALLDIIRSGTLSPSEIQAHRMLFVDIMKTKEDDAKSLTERDYYNVIDQAILCEDYDTASSWALLCEKRLKNELSHFNLLKVSYAKREEIGIPYD